MVQKPENKINSIIYGKKNKKNCTKHIFGRKCTETSHSIINKL